MSLGKKIKRIAEQEREGEAPAKRRGGIFGAFKTMKPVSQPQEEAAPTGTAGGYSLLKKVMKKVAARAAGKPVAMKKGGMADKSGRAMKRKTADTKGRAMKKGK